MKHLSEEQIQKLAANFLEFQKGKALYRREQISIETGLHPYENGCCRQARVRDLSQVYRVMLGEDGDCLCSCGEYPLSVGYCRHVIAVLLADGSEKEKQPVLTSGDFWQMVKDYQRLEEEVLFSGSRKKLKLLPRLLLDGERFSMDFRIQGERQFLIRDLTGFIRSYQRGDEISFGRNLTYRNTKAAYDLFSGRLLDLITLQVRQKMHHLTADRQLELLSEKPRELELEEVFADEYMELFTGEQIEVQIGEKDPFLVFIHPEIEKRPKLTLQMEACEPDGVRLFLENWHFFAGQKRLYLFCKEGIYRCSEEESRTLRPLFTWIVQKSRSGEIGLRLNQKDMPSFVHYILPAIKPYIEVQSGDYIPDEYEIPPLEAAFYLDRSGRDKLMLTCEARYGRYSFNPFLTSEIPARILRDRKKEEAVLAAVSEYFRYRDLGGRLYLTEDEDLYCFLKEGRQILESLGQVYMSDSARKLSISEVSIHTELSFVNHMMQICFDADGLSRKELAELLAKYRRKKKYHRFSNGDILRLEGELGDFLSELEEQELQPVTGSDQSLKISLPPWRSVYVDLFLKQRPQFKPEGREMLREFLKELQEPCQEEIPKELQTVLHDYQKKGFYWIKTLQKYHFCGILADDMGLGKTIQTISVLLADRQEGRRSIIICPASLIYNWMNEIARFAPGLKAAAAAGSAKERREKIENSDYQVLVTSYDLVRRDLDDYKKCSYYYIILDEAQYIKNQATMNARAVKQLISEHRLALTGTPIENRLEELWSIFDFLMPGFLYSYHRFHVLFGQTPQREDRGEREAAAEKLRQMIAPFLLCRKKKEVLTELPEKNEQIVYSVMEGLQEKLYLAAFSELRNQLTESKAARMAREYEKGKEDRMIILAQITRLRQICCDPAICLEGYGGQSAKLETCLELIRRAADSGHRVLLFSQFTSMLDRIRERLDHMGIISLMLTGATSKEERSRLTDAFQAGQADIFLISLKAGGTGLNLTAADIVIHYDPWWNAAAQNQATDRAYRIGQTRDVTVYKLIAKDSIEESILKLQEEKGNAARDVLSGSAELSGDEILEYLLTGSSGVD